MNSDITSMTESEDKKTSLQFLSTSPKGIKKKDFIEHPIAVLDSKGRLVVGQLKGYGEKYATIIPINGAKSKVMPREELIKQNLKLYVNPEDPTDVVIFSQQLSESIAEHAALPYQERKSK